MDPIVCIGTRTSSSRRVAQASACALALVLIPATTSAQIVIDVGAEEQQAWSDSQTFDPPVTSAWGWAHAAQNAGSGLFGTGPAPCDTIVCPPGPSLPGEAGGIARADAAAMNLGVRAWAEGAGFTPQGQAEVEVRDTLVINGAAALVFDIHLDLLLAVSAQPGSAGRYSYSIRLGSGDSATVPFALLAERRFTSANEYETQAMVLLDNGAQEIVLPQIPALYELSLPIVVFGSTDILLTASATADAPHLGSSNVNSYNSAWLGVQGAYASANGYSYPGFTPAVPEPATLVLWAAGLTAGCAWRRLKATGAG